MINNRAEFDFLMNLAKCVLPTQLNERIPFVTEDFNSFGIEEVDKILRVFVKCGNEHGAPFIEGFFAGAMLFVILQDLKNNFDDRHKLQSFIAKNNEMRNALISKSGAPKKAVDDWLKNHSNIGEQNG